MLFYCHCHKIFQKSYAIERGAIMRGLKIFESKQIISLYWFAVHQQISTSRQQMFDLFYPKFGAEFNKLCINV